VRNDIFKNIIFYSSSAYVAQILGLIMNIIVAKFLGPEDFGIWMFIMVLLSYGSYTELGVLSAAGRDLPILFGQGNFRLANIINASARYTSLGAAIIASLLLFCYAIFWNLSAGYAVALVGTALLLILQQFYTYHKIVVLRSYNHFDELSRQQIFLSFLTTLLSVFLVYTNGLQGRILAAVLASSTILIYAVLRNPWDKLPGFNWSITIKQIKRGMPIAISGLVITMLNSVDRLIVLQFLGEEELGFLSLSLMLVSIISILPQMTSQVLQNEFNFAYGASGRDALKLRNFIIGPSTVLSIFLPLVIGPLFLVLPVVVQTYLVEYSPGIRAAQYVTLGIYFYGILGMSDVFLITTGKIRIYILFGIIATVFNVLIDIAFIRLDLGIIGIALGGTLLTYFIFSFMIIMFSASHYFGNFWSLLYFFVKLILPFLFMIFILTVVELFLVCDQETSLGTQLFWSF
jgi:O-antigen/teichoic acid export membrane protein